MAVRILCIQVKSDAADRADMENVIGLNPGDDEIRSFLGTPQHQRFYDESSKRATYLTLANGVETYMVAMGITREVSELIEREMHGALSWITPKGFQDVVEKVTGESVHPGQPTGTPLAKWYKKP